MTRNLWLIFAALALIAAGVLLQYQPDRLAVAAPVDQQRPEVRIQHEFVRIPADAVGSIATSDRRAARTETEALLERSDPIAPERRSASETTPPPQRTPAVQRANRDPTLFEKARRAFVGDGRHRPEPFPKVR